MYMLYKFLHIISVILFLGVGIVSALNKLRADASKNYHHRLFAHRQIVFIDLLITIPSVILLPTTGFLMVSEGNISLKTPFVIWGILLYSLATVCWIPAWFIQVRLKNMLEAGPSHFEENYRSFTRLTRIWFLLGIPAGVASLVALYVMVHKGFV